MKLLTNSILLSSAILAVSSKQLSWQMGEYGQMVLGQPEKPVEPYSSQMKMATWKIPNFGEKKMSDPEIVSNYLNIMSRYEMVTIQGIRNYSGKAFKKLVANLCRRSGKNYVGITSERLSARGSSKKEQYGYIYNSDYLKVVDQWQYPIDTFHFERPPFVVQFELINHATKNGKKLTFVPVNINAFEAIYETNNLVKVYDAWLERAKMLRNSEQNKNVIFLGDFTLGDDDECEYPCLASDLAECWDKIELNHDPWSGEGRFSWMDAQVGMLTTKVNSGCASDHVVLSGEFMSRDSGICCNKAYYFDSSLGITAHGAMKISEHYPVEFEIRP